MGYEQLLGRDVFDHRAWKTPPSAWWLPPDGDPLGPMGLEVTCTMEGPLRLHVHQAGYEDTPRWQRYYAVIAPGWRSSLAALKQYLETA